MAKKSKTKTVFKGNTFHRFDIDTYIDKYIWAIIPVLAIIYFVFSKYSTGFYSDDELGHFVNMNDFWRDPGLIIGNWSKPGWKIFMVVPSLLGYDAVIFFNALISSTTVYVSILFAKKLNLKNTSLLIFLLGFQPIFFQLSFRSYAEIFTGLILILTCYLYLIEKYNFSMLLLGYLFLLRQETAVIIILVVAYLVISKKKYFPILFVAVFPLILQIFGMIKYNGDFMWMIKDLTSLGKMDFNKETDRGFFFYWANYIFIIGPVTLAFFLIGYFSFWEKNVNKKEFFKKYDILYLVFTTFFLIQCALVLHGTNAGLLRYMLPASPLAAVFACIGFNNLFKTEAKNIHLIILVGISVLSLAFMSRESNNWVMTDQTEYLKFLILSVITIIFVFGVYMGSMKSNKIFIYSIIILSIVYVYQKVEPLKPSSENQTVDAISDWLSKSEYKDKDVYFSNNNITFFNYIKGFYKTNKNDMNMQSIKDSPVGSIAIWDSHYSYNPRYENRNTKLEFIKNNTDFKIIKEFNSPDQKFYAAVFERIAKNN